MIQHRIETETAAGEELATSDDFPSTYLVGYHWWHVVLQRERCHGTITTPISMHCWYRDYKHPVEDNILVITCIPVS